MPSVMRLFGGLGGLEDDELRGDVQRRHRHGVVVAPAAAPR